MKKRLVFVLVTLFGALFNVSAEQVKTHVQVDERLMKVREIFAEREQKALEQKFIGVTDGSGKQMGLFPVKKTGVSTEQMINTANAFLSLLPKSQKDAVLFPIDDLEWQKWSNVDNGIYARQGLSLKAMTQVQKRSLFAFLNASLSIKGMGRVKNIMKTEHALRELNNNAVHLDEDLYFITMMGTPSRTEPWGWQFEGHHLVINYFILADQVVMSPVFMGAEPVKVESGKYKGTTVLQEQQDLGLALMQHLSVKQQQQAIIERKYKTNIKAEANKDNFTLAYEGIKASQMTSKQQSLLINLIGEYLATLEDGHAQIKLAEVSDHLKDTWFAWAGDVNDDAVFYYRIHSPVILIEFDHQAPIGLPNNGRPRQATRKHIHTIIRTPNGNDYGKDLLRQHLETHH